MNTLILVYIIRRWFMNPFDNFDAIYCINLDERKDRWQESQAEFRNLGILDRVERVSAVKYPEYKTNTVKYGNWGCRDSHIKCIEQASKAGHKTVMIFEDDVELVKGNYDPVRMNRSILECFAQPEWTMLYLGGNSLQGAERVTQDLIHISGANTTHAYAFNVQHFDEIKPTMKNCEYIDTYYRVEMPRDQKQFHSDPIYFDQRSSYSDIRAANRKYRIVANFTNAKRNMDNK
jgi:hypothetical protein